MDIPFKEDIFKIIVPARDYWLSLAMEIRAGAVAVFLALLFLIIALYFKSREHNRRLLFIRLLSELMERTAVDSSIDSCADSFMRMVSELVNARSYAFYIPVSNREYTLRTLCDSVADRGYISPSYGGLSPYRGETYAPPKKLVREELPGGTRIEKDGDIPLLVIPVPAANCFFRIGPVSGIKSGTAKTVNTAANICGPYLKNALRLDNLQTKYEQIRQTQLGTRNISTLFSDCSGMVKSILDAAKNVVNASYAFFIHFGGEKQASIYCSTGMDKQAADKIKNDTRLTGVLLDTVSSENMALIDENTFTGDSFPDYLEALNCHSLFLVKSKMNTGRGMIVLLNEEKPDIKKYRVTALLVFSRIIGNMVSHSVQFKQISHASIDLLKSLAQIMDSLSPYTAGRSELTSRFALILGNELGLERNRLYDLSIAAYLSNIGIIGISEKVFLKKGRYMKSEYEMMKLHSEIGAAIIESTTGNREMAKYVLQHHERVDGNGYPEGLKGEEISLQARIIAVVQVFLAKIKGREDREPLPFEKSIGLLKSASGTQLDSAVVDALAGWFEKKQANARQTTKSLGKCWEMMCIPDEICSKCPCYEDGSTSCWEHTHNNCREHGDNCSTCYVHSEYQYRKTMENKPERVL